MARIKPESSPLPVAKSGLFRLRPRVWAGLVLLVLLAFGAHFFWQKFARHVAESPQFRLTAAGVLITPPPAWIRTDLKGQVLSDAGLIGTASVLDDWDTLARRVKEAFEFHPWVAAVSRIERRAPNTLLVELKYRRPVAAVESSDQSGVMFLPIDEHAIRLPEVDLTDAERRYLPRISGVSGRPLIGDRWDDPRVLGGARLAAALADVWQQLRLVEILPASDLTRGNPQTCAFELVTTGGTRILWGTAPGQETSSGESPFEQKRRRILDYATQYGKLETIDGPEKLDVRSDLIVTPRTARHKPAADTADTTTK